MRDSRPKSAYLVGLGIRWIVRRHPGAVFATFTFAENVTDLHEAKVRWRPVADWIRRHGVVAVGAWQRQKRGAWHLHLVCSRRMDIVRLRDFAMGRGWGSFINLRPVSVHDPRSKQFGEDVDRTADYVSRYITRDMGGAAWGDSLTCYVGKSARVGSVKFAWAGGLSACWRAGCGLYQELYGHPPYLYQRDENFRSRIDPAMVDLVMQLGFEALLGDSRHADLARHPRFWGGTLPPPPEGQPW